MSTETRPRPPSVERVLPRRLGRAVGDDRSHDALVDGRPRRRRRGTRPAGGRRAGRDGREPSPTTVAARLDDLGADAASRRRRSTRPA